MEASKRVGAGAGGAGVPPDDNSNPRPKRGRGRGATDARRTDPWAYAERHLPPQNILPLPLVLDEGVDAWTWPPTRGYPTSQWFPYADAPPVEGSLPAQTGAKVLVRDAESHVMHYASAQDVSWVGDAALTPASMSGLHDAVDLSSDPFIVTRAVTRLRIVAETLTDAVDGEVRVVGDMDPTMPYGGLLESAEYVSVGAVGGPGNPPRVFTGAPDDGRVLHLLMRQGDADAVVSWVHGAIAAGWHDTVWKRAVFNGLAYPLAPQFVRDRVATMMADARTRAWMLAPHWWPLHLDGLRWVRETEGGPMQAPSLAALDNPAFAMRVDLLTACTLCNAPGSAALLAELLRGMRATGVDPVAVTTDNNPVRIIADCLPGAWAAAHARTPCNTHVSVAVEDVVLGRNGTHAPWAAPPELGNSVVNVPPYPEVAPKNTTGASGRLWCMFDRLFGLPPKLLAGFAYDWTPAARLYATLYTGHLLPGPMPVALPTDADVGGSGDMHIDAAVAKWRAARPYYGEPPSIVRRVATSWPADDNVGGGVLPPTLKNETAPQPMGHSATNRAMVLTKRQAATLTHTYPPLLTLLAGVGHMVATTKDFPPGFSDARAAVAAASPATNAIPDALTGRTLLRMWFDGTAFRMASDTARNHATEVFSMVTARYHPAIAEKLAAFFSGGHTIKYPGVTGGPWFRDRSEVRNRGWLPDVVLAVCGVYSAPLEDRIHALSAWDPTFPRRVPSIHVTPADVAAFNAACGATPADTVVTPCPPGTPVAEDALGALTLWNRPDDPPATDAEVPAPWWAPGNANDGNAAFTSDAIDVAHLWGRVHGFARGYGAPPPPHDPDAPVVPHTPAYAVFLQLQDVTQTSTQELEDMASAICEAHDNYLHEKYNVSLLQPRSDGYAQAVASAQQGLAAVAVTWANINAAVRGGVDVSTVPGLEGVIQRTETVLTAWRARTLVAHSVAHTIAMDLEVTDTPSGLVANVGILYNVAQNVGRFASRFCSAAQSLMTVNTTLETTRSAMAIIRSATLSLRAKYEARVLRMRAEVGALKAQRQALLDVERAALGDPAPSIGALEIAVADALATSFVAVDVASADVAAVTIDIEPGDEIV